MNSYLDLVPISEKIHRKQSRMTRLCIVLAVFLVASIFGMADMEIRNQRAMALRTDGAWHVAFREITKEQAAMIKAQPEVKHASLYAVTNYKLDEDYIIAGKKAAVCGFDEDFPKLYADAAIIEGNFPTGGDEAVVTDNLRQQMEARVGENVTLKMPGGAEKTYRIAGIAKATSLMAQYDAIGLYVNSESYGQTFMQDTKPEDMECYVEFKPLCNVQKTWKAICERLDIPQEQVAQNVKILGLMLQSSDSFIMKLYLTAAVLAVLVVTAGVLMIAGSMNSSVAKRTEFFGMLRCLGATCGQVKRFVRREALSWCRTAIPVSLALSIGVTAVLCQILKLLSPSYFEGMSFGISIVGLAAGTVIGVITVLLAANTPAKKAAEVSPLTAVSGNAGTVQQVKKAAGSRLFPVDIGLGIHHAKGSGRTLFLMSGSFAFSIILFLAFATMIDFMHHAVTPLRPYTPDLSIVSADETCSIPQQAAEELGSSPAVKLIYGRSFAYSVPVKIGEKEAVMCLISYEENQFAWAKEALLTGSVEEAEKGKGVLVEFYGNRSADLGEEVMISTAEGEKSYPITGILSYTPFQSEQGVIVCSEEVFQEITGEENYTVLDMQLMRGATEEDVEKIRSVAERMGKSTAANATSDSLKSTVANTASDNLESAVANTTSDSLESASANAATDNLENTDGDTSTPTTDAAPRYTFSDRRKSNQEARGAYYSFALFVYGFLAVIVLIAVFNIINSINMSASARMTQFGTMRAIGMSNKQVIRMVAAEAAAYALAGIALGAAVGIPVNRLLYQLLITSRWGEIWRLPIGALLGMIGMIAGAAALAVIGPAKAIREMSVVDTIGAL
ncbi:MAG: ABC transporter permease [Clostridium sp.]|nr:ABC transporter permease [Clostridium sp.]